MPGHRFTGKAIERLHGIPMRVAHHRHPDHWSGASSCKTSEDVESPTRLTRRPRKSASTIGVLALVSQVHEAPAEELLIAPAAGSPDRHRLLVRERRLHQDRHRHERGRTARPYHQGRCRAYRRQRLLRLHVKFNGLLQRALATAVMAGRLHGVAEATLVISVGVSPAPAWSPAHSMRPRARTSSSCARPSSAPRSDTRRVDQLVAGGSIRRTRHSFNIIDLSLAPTPAVGRLRGDAEKIGLEQVGASAPRRRSPCSTAQSRRAASVASSPALSGLSGAFIPVSEDRT